MRKLILLPALLLMVISSASAVQQLMSLQGRVTTTAGALVSSGNLTVLVYDAASGGNLIWNSSNDFNNVIQSGYFDVMLGSVRNLTIENNKIYYMDLEINQEDIDWNGVERRQFQSSVGTNFTGDTNFTFDTNTLFVDSTNNNVGIGTTSPAKKFVVNNWMRVTDGTVNADFYTTGSNTYIGDVSGYPLHLTTGNAAQMTIDGSGNVGIGTTTPTTKLHVIGDLNISANATIGGGLLIGASDYTKTGSYFLNVSGNASVNNTFFVNTNGKVGIGITGPTKLLHVYDGTGIAGYGYPAIFEGASGLGNAYVTIKASNQAYTWYNTTGYDKSSWVVGSETDGTNNTFRISTLNSGFVGDRSAKLIIGVNGNVGIGTTNPQTALDVQSYQFFRYVTKTFNVGNTSVFQISSTGLGGKMIEITWHTFWGGVGTSSGYLMVVEEAGTLTTVHDINNNAGGTPWVGFNGSNIQVRTGSYPGSGSPNSTHMVVRVMGLDDRGTPITWTDQ